MSKAAMSKPNRGVPKQKVEAKNKRLAAVKAMQKQRKEREKQRKANVAKAKKTAKNVLKTAGRTAKRADKFASGLFKGFKW